MRITVLILGLLLGLLMFIQTVLVGAGGSIGEDEATAQAGSVGFFAAILWLVACAFVLPFPLVSVVAFLVAALMSFAVSGDYPDMAVWGGVAVVLAVFSLLGWFGKRRDRRRDRLREQALADRDARMEAMLAAQQRPQASPAQTIERPSCHRQNAVGSKFCAECGARVSFPASSQGA